MDHHIKQLEIIMAKLPQTWLPTTLPASTFKGSFSIISTHSEQGQYFLCYQSPSSRTISTFNESYFNIPVTLITDIASLCSSSYLISLTPLNVEIIYRISLRCSCLWLILCSCMFSTNCNKNAKLNDIKQYTKAFVKVQTN